MEFVISLAVVGKILAFIVISGMVAVVTLSPVNDQDISKTQFAVFAIIEALVLAGLCGVLTFKVVA